MSTTDLHRIGLTLDACQPPVWARSGHAQTLLAHFLRETPAFDVAELERVEIPLADGDRLVARFLDGPRDRVLMLFHGLTGEASAGYMLRTAKVGQELGWKVYVVNHRGCGEGNGLARGPYHSGRAEDLSEAIAFARARHPTHRLTAAGFSLSANALLLLVAGHRGTSLPDAAVAVSAPIDLDLTSRMLERGLNRIYDQAFSIGCRAEVRKKERHGLLDRRYRFPWVTSLRDFDELYTAVAGGFSSRDEYYGTCSAYRVLGTINTPTVLLTAKDDPFIDYRSYVNAKRSPSVLLHVEEVGGHLGFLASSPTKRGTRRWLDYALGEIFVALDQNREIVAPMK